MNQLNLLPLKRTKKPQNPFPSLSGVPTKPQQKRNHNLMKSSAILAQPKSQKEGIPTICSIPRIAQKRPQNGTILLWPRRASSKQNPCEEQKRRVSLTPLLCWCVCLYPNNISNVTSSVPSRREFSRLGVDRSRTPRTTIARFHTSKTRPTDDVRKRNGWKGEELTGVDQAEENIIYSSTFRNTKRVQWKCAEIETIVMIWGRVDQILKWHSLA